jgi:hypothetical protein
MSNGFWTRMSEMISFKVDLERYLKGCRAVVGERSSCRALLGITLSSGSSIDNWHISRQTQNQEALVY